MKDSTPCSPLLPGHLFHLQMASAVGHHAISTVTPSEQVRMLTPLECSPPPVLAVVHPLWSQLWVKRLSIEYPYDSKFNCPLHGGQEVVWGGKGGPHY